MKKEETPALPARAELRAATWTGARTYTIKLWAYLLPQTSKSPTAKVDVWLQDVQGNRAHALVRPLEDPAANEGSANTSIDVSRSAFEAVFDFDSHLAAATVQGKTLTVHLSISDGQQSYESTLTNRYRWGSAGALEASGFPNDIHVVPSWSAQGLQFKVAERIAVAHAQSFVGRELCFWVKTNGAFTPTLAVLKDEADREVPASTFKREGSWVEVAFNLANLPECTGDNPEPWRFYLQGEAGERRLLHWSTMPATVTELDAGATLTAGPSGVVRLDRVRHNIAAESAAFYPRPSPHLVISGSYAGETARPLALSLEGQRSRIEASLITNNAGRFVFSVPLVLTSESGPLSVPSGGYRATVQFDDGSHEYLRPARTLVAGLYTRHSSDQVNVRLERSPANEIYVHVGAPLLPNELGDFNQRKLSTASRNARQIQSDDFYFESWFGKNFSDSPLALFKEVRRRLPDAKLYVGVADLSVSVPDGAVRVVRNSKQWWRVLADSKYVITNCWAPDRFQPHKEQVLVQTWHGTPLKLLGLDRPGSREKASRVAKLEKDANQWSILLSQNRHSTAVFRRAYAYGGEIIESGYPRNDELFDSDAFRKDVRNSLNIPDENTVILYAPTWREGSAGSSDLLDAGAMASILGPNFTVLVRGHSVSLRRGENVRAAGVIDVTTYNDPAGLMAAADVLVTDYSSIMFDFSVTRKPVIFYVPDWDDYTGSGRGVYFNLADKAPGPLCHSRQEVIDALRGLPESGQKYESAYAAWTKEFNPWDNPRSSEMVVSRILELGNENSR